MSSANFILPKFYRNFALLYFIFALGAMVAVFYLIWAGVTIVIHPSQSVTNQEVTFAVVNSSAQALLQGDDVINGRILTVTVNAQESFPTTGAEVLSADSTIVGEVTVINDYSQDQTLVETTRLAAPDDPETVLVRLNQTVVVLAGQRLAVQVYADDPAGFQPIGPRRFIIPGLWGPLQERIYAENAETLTQEERTITVVSDPDLLTARATLERLLAEQAVERVNEQLTGSETLWPKLVTTEPGDPKFDAQVGDQVSSFNGEMNLAATVVTFDESAVIALARQHVGGSVGSVDANSFSYTINDVDVGQQTAEVTVSFSGRSLAATNGTLLDKSPLLGKTAEEVKNYFSQFPEVDAVEVIFSPAWLKKTPRLSDKIKIEVAP